MSGFRSNSPRQAGHERHGLSPGGGSGDRGQLENLLRPPAEPVRYFLANNPKAVDAKLLGEEAETVAKKLSNVPVSQLRRFYAEVMALKRRTEFGAADDAEIQAHLTLLRARATYTWGRQSRYPGELIAFFTRHAHSVKTKQDFLRGFQPHFEAVMAFHKVFESARKGAE